MNYFWVPTITPMISVVLSTFCVFITRANKDGVAIVNHIDKGINPPSLNEIHTTREYIFKGFRIGVVAGIIALTEAIAIRRTFAAMKDYQLDGNKEMVALGTMNIVGSMTSSYVATGSFSRSAGNYMAGCHAAVSNIVMSIVVLLTLELITALFKYTLNARLAYIIIAAVLNLIDINAALLLED